MRPLTLYNTSFDDPEEKAFLKTMMEMKKMLKTLCEKETLLITNNFSFSHSVFYPFGELSAIFIKIEIVVWKLFQFGSI